MSIQGRKKNPSAFLKNIFQILNNSDHAQIIHWTPQGNGFIIKDLPYFEANILPLFFKHKKYSSFVRQLNMYGFHKQRNSNFQNCFLHDQFRRGNELPTDIKRKPEKKKRTIEPILQPETKQANWLTFSQELRRHFPHIAKNILVGSDSGKNKKLPSNENAVSFNQNASEQKILQQHDDDDSEHYVSRISLKGFMEDFEEKSSNFNKNQIPVNKSNSKVQFEEQDSNYPEKEMSQLVKNQSQSDDFGERKSFSFLKFKDSVINLQSGRLSMELGQNEENLQKFNHLSTVSLSFLDNNLQSLEGVNEVLMRQNEVLQKTHSTIRNVVLKSQQNRITYLNRQLTSLENTENHDMNIIKEERQDSMMEKLFEEEKQQLTGLTYILEQQIQGLTEFMLSEEEMPISTTSIKCRLQRLDSNKI